MSLSSSMDGDQRAPLRICVVGGGISGLASGWLLGNSGHSVTLLESLDEVGMGAAYYDVTAKDGCAEGVRIDVPFRVVNIKHYANLARLLACVGVALEPCDYALTFYDLASTSVIFRYVNQYLFGRRYVNPLVMGFSLLSPSFLSLAFNWVKWRFYSWTDLHSGAAEGLSFGDYLSLRSYSEQFKTYFLYPTFCTILTCDAASVARYPADMLLRSFHASWGHGVKRTVGGTSAIVSGLCRKIDTVRTGVVVDKVVPNPQGGVDVFYKNTPKFATATTPAFTAMSPSVPTRSFPASGEEAPMANSSANRTTTRDHFDAVVVCTQAEHVAALVASYAPEIKEAMTGWTWERSSVVVHTDATLMPGPRTQWGSINLGVSPSAQRPQATMWMNKLEPRLEGASDIFQTWNPIQEPEESTVKRRVEFSRPLMSSNVASTMAKLEAVNGQHNVWICGSYTEYGPPLLENGVRSAMAVARSLGASIPWSAVEADRDSSGLSSHVALPKLLVRLVFGLVLMWVAWVLAMGRLV